ncbi:alpha-L-glutamate ligase [Streptomyces sp. SP17BM10]|uniref:ATP-grasp domain-containing protein n=1 Tax=Streptomyces sp. SP17BM10 TaxID=3002530 RepID=UPI002E79E8AC|nr:alpha-L-glutamate ligase [Streptomyces sp. SP17BM10]MEE1788296.1 alpha-L-glutamate ligase [Streptomyces sp. SP17BM10]
MSRRDLVLLTDHGSTEGTRDAMATAVRRLTGRDAVPLDARHFMTDDADGLGGTGRIEAAGGSGVVRLEVPGRTVTTDTVVVYEIPPHRRPAFAHCQRLLRAYGVRSLGTDAEAWRAATEKDVTVARFARDGVPHMPTIALSRPSPEAAAEAFGRLGGDVWARPCVGMGGDDVFHVTTLSRLDAVARHYADLGTDWLIAADARNFTVDGQRHQYRVVVLGGRVLRAAEHVQGDPDAPCNEIQGAVATVLDVDGLPPGVAELAVSAAKSLGLPFAGVDLAAESGGVVFEVNVHPAFGSTSGVDQVAVPYVAAHLER